MINVHYVVQRLEAVRSGFMNAGISQTLFPARWHLEKERRPCGCGERWRWGSRCYHESHIRRNGLLCQLSHLNYFLIVFQFICLLSYNHAVPSPDLQANTQIHVSIWPYSINLLVSWWTIYFYFSDDTHEHTTLNPIV